MINVRNKNYDLHPFLSFSMFQKKTRSLQLLVHLVAGPNAELPGVEGPTLPLGHLSHQTPA